MVSWNETFVPGEGLDGKSRAKAMVVCLVGLTWRSNPTSTICDPRPRSPRFKSSLKM